MEKRTLIAVVICMAILFVWTQYFTPTQTPPPAQTTGQTAGSGNAPPAKTAAAPQGQTTGAGGPAGAPVAERRPEERVTLESPQVRYTVSSWGGTLVAATLTERRFLQNKTDPRSGLNLVPALPPHMAPLRTSFGDAALLPNGASWAIAERSADAVTFRLEAGTLTIEKRYRLQAGSSQLGLEVVVENRGQRAVSERLVLHVPARQDPEKIGGGFFTYATNDPAQLVCYANGKIERSGIDGLVGEPDENTGAVRWVAADEKFFTLAVVPHPEPGSAARACSRSAQDNLNGEVTLAFAPRSVPPSGTTSYKLTVFAGPKNSSELETVVVGGEPAELEKLVDVTFAVLARPLLFLLRTFHGWVGNWGLAIIMLTFSVKLLTFYPTQKAMMSGKRMQRLAPEMGRIRKQFENDRQRQGVETMALYKKHGVSPFGGCLPSLITMPIWIALFSTLNYAVELHRAPFFGYIHDLSARDPYFITPLLMGAIMYLQMRMSPAGVDPAQQKMMSVMMPVMFTSFSLFLPAGLAIYTLTNSLLAILHQLLVNRIDKRLGPIPTA